MNLTSCENCGVVLNTARFPTEDELYSPDGSVDLSKFTWVDRQYSPMLTCPMCDEFVVLAVES